MVEMITAIGYEGIWASSNLVTCAEYIIKWLFICFKCIA